MADERDPQEDEICLIRLEVVCDSNAGRRLENVQTRREEIGCGEIDGKRDGDVSGDKGPSADPGGDTTTPLRRQGKGLVVDTASSGIYGRDLSQRSCDAHHDQGHQHPAPNHVC